MIHFDGEKGEEFTIAAWGWYHADDAVADKDGHLLYWPNRMERLWKIRRLWWSLLGCLGKRASSTAPSVVKSVSVIDSIDDPFDTNDGSK